MFLIGDMFDHVWYVQVPEIRWPEFYYECNNECNNEFCHISYIAIGDLRLEVAIITYFVNILSCFHLIKHY